LKFSPVVYLTKPHALNQQNVISFALILFQRILKSQFFGYFLDQTSNVDIFLTKAYTRKMLVQWMLLPSVNKLRKFGEKSMILSKVTDRSVKHIF